MNEVYRQPLAKLTDANQKALLVEAERTWIAYRENSVPSSRAAPPAGRSTR